MTGCHKAQSQWHSHPMMPSPKHPLQGVPTQLHHQPTKILVLNLQRVPNREHFANLHFAKAAVGTECMAQALLRRTVNSVLALLGVGVSFQPAFLLIPIEVHLSHGKEIRLKLQFHDNQIERFDHETHEWHKLLQRNL